MKGVFWGGALALIVIIVIGVMVTTGLIWFTTAIKPLVILLFGSNVSIIVLYLFSFLAIILIAVVLGYLIRILPKTRLMKKYTERSKNIQNKPVVLVKLPNDVYAIGIAVENQEILTKEGTKMTKRVFVPSVPIPFTGWIILADENNVIPINYRYQEFLALVSSLGTLGPKSMIEIIANNHLGNNLNDLNAPEPSQKP
jgi:hypothetical protein